MRTPLYIADEVPTVEGEDGRKHRMNGYRVVGQTDDGRYILHASPSTPPPEGAEIVYHPGEDWRWPDLKARRPDVARCALRARIVRGKDGVDAKREALEIQRKDTGTWDQLLAWAGIKEYECEEAAAAEILVREERAERRTVCEKEITDSDVVLEDSCAPHYWA